MGSSITFARPAAVTVGVVAVLEGIVESAATGQMVDLENIRSRT